VLNRAGALKGTIAGIWEIPSETLARQYADMKVVLPKAIADGNAVLAKAASVSAELAKSNITLTVPPVAK
jgi:hypothetical protein